MFAQIYISLKHCGYDKSQKSVVSTMCLYYFNPILDPTQQNHTTYK